MRKVRDSELNLGPVNLERQLFCSNHFSNGYRLHLASAVVKHCQESPSSAPLTHQHSEAKHLLKSWCKRITSFANRSEFEPSMLPPTRYGDLASYLTYMSCNVQQETYFGPEYRFSVAKNGQKSCNSSTVELLTLPPFP